MPMCDSGKSQLVKVSKSQLSVKNMQHDNINVRRTERSNVMNLSTKRIFLCWLILVILQPLVYAQPKGNQIEPASITKRGEIPTGHFVVTGTLLRKDGTPVSDTKIMLTGVMKMLDTGSIAFFFAKSNAEGVFRIEIENSRIFAGEEREANLQAGLQDSQGVSRMTFLRDEKGVPIVFKFDKKVTEGEISLGRITVTDN